MRYFLLLFSLLFFTSASQAQDLLTGLRNSPYTYIYALTNPQARKAYKDELKNVDPTYFQQLVDSFATGSLYPKKLAPGNYLFVHAKQEQLVLELEGVHNVSLQLIPDPKRLVAAFYSPQGELIEGAFVTVNGRRMAYQTDTRLYQRRYRQRWKLLEVEHQGVSNFFALQPQGWGYGRSRTLVRKVIYFKPVRLLWKPVQDVVHSIRWGETQGWLRLFDRSLEPHERWGRERRLRGYLAMNQPVYRTGDTVFYKAFALKKHRPFKKPLELELRGRTRSGYRTFSLGTLTPYRPGAYEGYLLLHDSLGLQLDTYPELMLSHRRFSLEQQFKLEDYELRGNTFTMSASSDSWVQGAQPVLILRAADVNGLPLMGAELELQLVTERVGQLAGPSTLSIPDTLWRHKLQLEPVSETQLKLPDSIFYPAAIRYTLLATLKTPQQEFLREKLSGHYSPQRLLDLQLQGDSLHLRWLEQGVSVARRVSVSITAAGQPEQQLELQLPQRLKIDPLWQEVAVQRGPMREVLQLGNKPSLVAHEALRTPDSLLIRFSSGRGIPYWYSIYRGKRSKRRIAGGYSSGDPLLWKQKVSRGEAYYVQLNYLWGGQIHKEQEQIPLLKKMLQLELQAVGQQDGEAESPATVTPGQKVALGVQVRDYKGRPVKGVDVTALAYNKQLPGSLQPGVPYLGREKQYPFFIRQPRQLVLQVQQQKELNWPLWRQRLGLDSIAFYQFLYPGQEVYTHTLPTPDSSTQLAPFVVEKGVPQQVHVLYLNDVPVYYSEVATQRPYSFLVDSNRSYKVSMRTARHLITLDSMRFAAGQKTILSLGKEVEGTRIRVEEMLPQLTPLEINRLNNYLIVVNHSYNQHYTYLEQEGQLQLVNVPSASQHTRQVLAGPFTTSSLRYEVIDKFKTSFQAEPGYQYRITPGMIFAKETKPVRDPSFLRPRLVRPRFEELALTEPQVQQLWQQYLALQNKKEVFYNYPRQTAPGAGKIGLRYSWDSLRRQQPPQLQQVLVLGLSDAEFVQVYPINMPLTLTDALLHNLPPGRYKLLGLLSDSTYLQLDSLPVLAHATTFADLREVPLRPADQSIEHIRTIMLNNASSWSPGEARSEKRIQQELSYFGQLGRMQSSGSGSQLIQGRVTDASAGDGLPGVAVTVKGSNIGTVTDMDGNYSLYLNPGDVLIFSFVGFASREEAAGGKSRLDIELAEDIEQLQEVVVTGYGAIAKKEMTYALQGAVAGVQIRGAASNDWNWPSDTGGEGSPLIIIDGVPFTGDVSTLDPALMSAAILMKGEEAAALYGSRAAGGAILITTGTHTRGKGKEGAAPALLGVGSQQNSLRSNFRDWAFWQPRLLTDAQGRASFTARFPDDVTAWETQLLAIGNKRYSGYSSQTIRAVKALWAALAMPRFLLSGDSAQLMGQVNNYTPDSLPVRTLFTIEGRPQGGRNAQLITSLQDSAWISPQTTDSLTLTYEVMGQQGGLLDGERRKLPVYRRGVREARGEFLILRPDSAHRLQLAPSENPWQLQAYANKQEPLLQEVHALLDFAYYCNEQAASKLYALLLMNRAQLEQDKQPRRQALIKRLIRQLEETQRPQDGLWGWWQTHTGELWITRHIVGALQLAKEEGYPVKYDPAALQKTLRWQLQGSRYPREQLQLLEVLSQLKGRGRTLSGADSRTGRQPAAGCAGPPAAAAPAGYRQYALYGRRCAGPEAGDHAGRLLLGGGK
ncbi:carboxypeptidase-like regulatory domain-containing protein [Cesiribacter andamanensis]|uniref:Outer membrane cobalamin receptor protein n=1 Tax=Cesiribacter andamanensis AMV16 TaxID=1279009 RepID=M7NQD4_9BACT|nr:carboxypeptidase-like regulatory domain-containing protein [Cesiribacter andamanensis]EMR03935.1 Outer membrane cobalamin receptor protein [Cesiribacter andamanensis AMV16]